MKYNNSPIEEHYAIITGENASTIFPIKTWDTFNSENNVVRLILDSEGGSKSISVPKNMTFITSGLTKEEVDELASQLSGDKPVSHFTVQNRNKDLNEMLNEDKEEELTEDKTLSLPSNIF